MCAYASRIFLVGLLFGAAVATWDETDKAKDVSQFHVEMYTAAGCAAADKAGDDYKEVGTCTPKDVTDLAQGYEKGFVNDTHYYKQTFSDASCATVTNAEDGFIAKGCHEYETGQWRKGVVDSAVGTLYLGKFTASDCAASTQTDFVYHGGDVCHSDSGGSGSDMHQIAGNDGDLKHVSWNTSDCTGAQTVLQSFTGNGVCTAFPSGHEDVGKYYRVWVWKADGGHSPTTTTTITATTTATTFAATASSAGPMPFGCFKFVAVFLAAMIGSVM